VSFCDGFAPHKGFEIGHAGLIDAQIFWTIDFDIDYSIKNSRMWNLSVYGIAEYSRALSLLVQSLLSMDVSTWGNESARPEA
jgi:hypothetical protein